MSESALFLLMSRPLSLWFHYESCRLSIVPEEAPSGGENLDIIPPPPYHFIKDSLKKKKKETVLFYVYGSARQGEIVDCHSNSPLSQ